MEAMPWQQTDPMDQRTRFALEALQSENFRALCRQYGISAKTGYKWKERLLRYGVGGLAEESRRPHAHPDALDEATVCAIVRLKHRHQQWGPRKLRDIYLRQHAGQGPSESSFKRVLEKAGLVDKRRVRRPVPGARMCSGRRAQSPNEVWSIDFKGWWHDAEGQRCEPLTVRDEYSRYVLESYRVADARTQTVWERLEALFERHGLPQAMRSDNGPPFASARGLLGLSRLSSRWVALGIGLERSRPGCPQDNGAHERMHRDMSQQLQKVQGGWSQEALDVWREEFNHQRPHEALGMKRPAEIYHPSERRYGGLPEELDYGAMNTRKIRQTGHLVWQQQPIFISSALGGWNVGLQPRHDGLLDIYFAELLLGQLEPSTLSFIRGASASNEADKPTMNP
jgi:transposase InsO family protein